MGTNQSLENLLSAKPENILQQLFLFNSKIHSAGKDEILAIFFTLKGAERMVDVKSTAWQQIYDLQQSCRARMRAIVAKAEANLEPTLVKSLKILFKETAQVLF